MAQKRTIAVLIYDQVNAIDVAGPIEAFSSVALENDFKPYTIVSWAINDAIVRTESGLRLCADKLAPQRPRADTLIIPGGRGIRDPQTLSFIASWLRKHHERFERIVSVCSGAYALAESELANGRKLTTHWAHADDLQRSYPEIRVDSDALFLRDGRFYSSGGVTAGIDLAIDLIESDFSGQVAMSVAREMVVFLRRTGTQGQFSMPLRLQMAASDRLSEVCRWAANNLSEDLTVEALAARAGLSSRQFSRRFRETFGAPPAAYVKRLRLDFSRTMLCEGVSIEEAASASGFESADGFRRAFEGRFGVTPSQYKIRFAQTGMTNA